MNVLTKGKDAFSIGFLYVGWIRGGGYREGCSLFISRFKELPDVDRASFACALQCPANQATVEKCVIVRPAGFLWNSLLAQSSTRPLTATIGKATALVSFVKATIVEIYSVGRHQAPFENFYFHSNIAQQRILHDFYNS